MYNFRHLSVVCQYQQLQDLVLVAFNANRNFLLLARYVPNVAKFCSWKSLPGRTSNGHISITVLDRRMVTMDTVMEVWRLKDNGVTSLTFWGHVT